MLLKALDQQVGFVLLRENRAKSDNKTFMMFSGPLCVAATLIDGVATKTLRFAIWVHDCVVHSRLGLFFAESFSLIHNWGWQVLLPTGGILPPYLCVAVVILTVY